MSRRTASEIAQNVMSTVTVTFTVWNGAQDYERLISQLPRERKWLISKAYDDDGNVVIVIGFEGYGLLAADMRVLEAYPGVISYETAHSIWFPTIGLD